MLGNTNGAARFGQRVDFCGNCLGESMLNRRNFLKTGLTGAGVIPLTSALLDAMPASPLEQDTTVDTDKVVSLPQRLPAIDQSTVPWQQKVRRVGQTNMTEYDPAVMNVEQWADYWHSAEVD